jgi:hypothetical protein
MHAIRNSQCIEREKILFFFFFLLFLGRGVGAERGRGREVLLDRRTANPCRRGGDEVIRAATAGRSDSLIIRARAIVIAIGRTSNCGVAAISDRDAINN